MRGTKLASLPRRYAKFFQGSSEVPFCLEFSNGRIVRLGDGDPEFTLRGINERGDAAIIRWDLLELGGAFIRGDLVVTGSLFRTMEVRDIFSDRHPLVWIARFLPSVVGRGTRHDRSTIASHYDRDPEFFATFLDEKYMCYTQGSFAQENEALTLGIEHKLGRAFEKLHLRRGSNVLEVGGGWGAFVRYAGERGVHVTSLTLSSESAAYMRDVIKSGGLPGTVIQKHFLEFRSKTQFDAIVNMGTTEHLPDYRTTLRQYERLTRPGGRIYVDALAMRRMHRVSSFMSREIYPGRSSPLVLHRYLRALAQTNLELVEVHDERENYYLTCRKWHRNLTERDQTEVARWEPEDLRRFELFLLGSAASFWSGHLQAYSVVMRQPLADRIKYWAV